MKKYEYQTKLIELGMTKKSKNNPVIAPEIFMLNEQGQQGWQLACTVDEVANVNGADTMVRKFYLYREAK